MCKALEAVAKLYETADVLGASLETDGRYLIGEAGTLVTLDFVNVLFSCPEAGTHLSAVAGDADTSGCLRIESDVIFLYPHGLDNRHHGEIVIVCLGINDYNTSSVTVNDIKTSVATVFSVLADKFKTARVVFLTPFNSSAAGTAATQYAYNSQKGGRTLKDIADAIIEACATNQIECHNVSANFCLNNYNITTLLGDGVHPTQDGHTVIARTLLHLFV